MLQGERESEVKSQRGINKRLRCLDLVASILDSDILRKEDPGIMKADLILVEDSLAHNPVVILRER